MRESFISDILETSLMIRSGSPHKLERDLKVKWNVVSMDIRLFQAIIVHVCRDREVEARPCFRLGLSCLHYSCLKECILTLFPW